MPSIRIGRNGPQHSVKVQEDKECVICYETAQASEFLEIDECKHAFCKDCVEQYLDQLISTRKILKLVCPQHGCGKALKYSLLKSVLSGGQLEKYDRFKRDLEISLDKYMVYCPNSLCA
jgi:hypothetical protein